MSNFSPHEFIDDFLEESAEHLQSINRNLLALEHTLEGDATSAELTVSRQPIISELFRSFHTLKGLSGMVGLSQAEELSHKMESVLRAIQNHQLEVTLDVIDRLLDSTRVVEAVISSLTGPELPEQDVRRSLLSMDGLLNLTDLPTTEPIQPGTPAEIPASSHKRKNAPSSSSQDRDGDLEASLGGVFREHPEVATQLELVDRERIRMALAAGNFLYLVFFSPTPEKAARGINVNEVREHILQTGELIKGIPFISGANIRFAFLVSAAQPIKPEQLPEAEVVFLSRHAPEAALSAPGPVSPSRPAGAAMTSVRVELRRLDDLMNLVSELIIKRSRLMDLLPQLEQVVENGKAKRVVEALQQTTSQIDRNLRDMRQAVMRARMVPLAEVFSHMPLAARDLARSSGKEVRLEMEGERTEIDKVLVERLLDPILHLVRNAITHGIEPSAERIAAGKPAAGTLRLLASLNGDQIVIQVQDDGRGVDVERVRRKAASMGLALPERELEQSEILDLLMRSGFSTIQEADLGAGRGVGMDVVRQTVRSLSGSIELFTQEGLGTTFILRLPLTLTIIDAVIVRCGTERYAVPLHTVQEVIEIDPEKVVAIEKGELLPYRESSLSLIRLEDLFHLPPAGGSSYLYGLVAYESDSRTALVVDQLVGLREVVVRTLNDPFVAQPGIFAATELGDGKPILIIDMPALLSQSRLVR